MIRRLPLFPALLLAATFGGTARGQPIPPPAPAVAQGPDEPVDSPGGGTGNILGPVDGGVLEPRLGPSSLAMEPPPVLFAEWLVTGELIDDPAALRSFLAPAMQVRQVMTREAREDLGRICQRIGYELADLRLERSQRGRVVAVLKLKPILVVRHVRVHLGGF